jgi:aspartate aminotransferase
MHRGEDSRQPQPSVTMELAARCQALRESGRDVIDLAIGEPDFRTPDFAAQAGIAAIVQGCTHYTPAAGLPALRHCIAEHLSARSRRDITTDAIVVTAGVKQALFNCFQVLFSAGDEVLLPVPYWTSYPPLIALAGARPVPVPAPAGSGMRVDVAALEVATTDRTRGLLLNSPCNPSGVVYSAEELLAIVTWAASRGLWVVADEIYGRICYDAERAPSVLELPAELLRRVVVVDGASKAFAMTGWRLGFSWSASDVAERMSALQGHVSGNASTLAQHAGIALFRDEPRLQHAVRGMVGVLRHRRDKAVSLLRQGLPDVPFLTPAGAFYLFLQVDGCFTPARRGSAELSAWLLDNTGVAVVPGVAFGSDAHVRLSFAAPQAEVAEGIARLAEALGRRANPLPIHAQ